MNVKVKHCDSVERSDRGKSENGRESEGAEIEFLYSLYKIWVMKTYHPGTSSGSSQLPVPSLSPILNTVPIGQPYSRATPSKQM